MSTAALSLPPPAIPAKNWCTTNWCRHTRGSCQISPYKFPHAPQLFVPRHRPPIRRCVCLKGSNSRHWWAIPSRLHHWPLSLTYDAI
jgi:hypothetical protein